MISFFVIAALLAAAQAQCPGSGGVEVNGQCWYIATFNGGTQSCDSFCPSVGGVADANEIINVAGSGAADSTGCQDVVDAFGFTAIVQDVSGTQCNGQGLGCFFGIGESLRCTSPTTTTGATANIIAGGRYCACDVAASSGFTDPHFSGFNGESLDIQHDAEHSDKYFNVFCQEKVAINTLFSPNEEDLLYMTKFVTKFGNFELEMTLEEAVASGEYTIEINESGKRYNFEGGFAVVSEAGVSVHFEKFLFHFESAFDNNQAYLDMYVQGPRKGQHAEGIVGRTLSRKFSVDEFSSYSRYLRKAANDFTCEL